MDILVIILFGILIGAFASLVGVGGGIVMVPLLTLAYNQPKEAATGTSLFVIIFTSIASTLAYLKQGLVNFKIGLPFLILTSLSVFVGRMIVTVVNQAVFNRLFAVFMVMMMISMILDFLKNRKHKAHAEEETQVSSNENMLNTVYPVREMILSIPIALFAGTLSGLFGIGSGTIIIPLLVIIFKFKIKEAIATSLFIMLGIALIGTSIAIYNHEVIWRYGIALACGIIPGAFLGSRLNKIFPSSVVTIIFLCILLFSVLKFLVG